MFFWLRGGYIPAGALGTVGGAQILAHGVALPHAQTSLSQVPELKPEILS
jgi:hypothetical protein